MAFFSSSARKTTRLPERIAAPDKSGQLSPVRRWLPWAVLAALLAVAPFLYLRVSHSAEAEAHLYRGGEWLKQGDPSQAEQEWRAAERLAPNNPNVPRMLGALYLAQRRFAEARTAYNRLADLAPKEPHTLCELARLELRLGTAPMLEAASKDSQRAATLEPDCVLAQTVAGDALIEQGDSRQGIAHLQRAVALKPADVSLTLHLANALLEANRLPEAAQVAKELTRRYPGYAQGYAMLGTIYLLSAPETTEAKEAPALLKKAARLEPTNVLAQERLGHYYLSKGDYREAVRYLEAALLLGAKRTPLLFALSRVYHEVGREAEAKNAQREFDRRSTLENQLTALERRTTQEPDNAALRQHILALARALGDAERIQQYEHQETLQTLPGTTSSGGQP